MPNRPDPNRYDPADRNTQIRRAVRAEMKERGMSQRVLADLMLKHPNWVSLKLTGMAPLYGVDVIRFLDALECDLVDTPHGVGLVDRQTPVV